MRPAFPQCEHLETRELLSVGSTVFSRFGTIDQPGQTATVDLPLGSNQVQTSPSGSTVYDIHVARDSGSHLIPGAVRLTNQAGASIMLPVSPSGDVLIPLRPGDYSLTVRGRGASTGAFVVSVELAGDVNGDGLVNFHDVSEISAGLPTPGASRTDQLARRNQGVTNVDPSITFHIVNATNPKSNPSDPPAYPSSQIYVAITGQNAAGQFVHLDLNGNPVPMQLSDNTAANHLTKNGVDYSNYFYTLNQVQNGWDVPYGLKGARLWVGLGSPLYFQVNTDVNSQIGYTTPNLSNASDPNINIYWDE
jgi:hypothetical protein